MQVIFRFWPAKSATRQLPGLFGMNQQTPGFDLVRSPIGLLLVDFVMKPDFPANLVFGDPGVWRQDFQNLSPLVFVPVGVVNQLSAALIGYKFLSHDKDHRYPKSSYNAPHNQWWAPSERICKKYR